MRALEIHDESLAGTRSFLGVPLLLADRVVGALTLADPSRVPAFDERHQRSLVTLAAQIALTIENAHLYEMAAQATATAQQRAAQLGTLAGTLAAVTTGQRVAEVIDLALAQLELLLPYEQAAFWRPIESDWQLVAAQRGDDQPAHPALPAPLAAQIATTRAPLLAPNARSDERFAGQPERPAAWLGLPVFSQNELVGLISLESTYPMAISRRRCRWPRPLLSRPALPWTTPGAMRTAWPSRRSSSAAAACWRAPRPSLAATSISIACWRFHCAPWPSRWAPIRPGF